MRHQKKGDNMNCIKHLNCQIKMRWRRKKGVGVRWDSNGGQLLPTISLDGNNNIFPITCAVVKNDQKVVGNGS